jgi:hypothetical protein
MNMREEYKQKILDVAGVSLLSVALVIRKNIK